MLGIVIPAHNEGAYIGECLASVARAAANRELQGEKVNVTVVLDDCTDETKSIVRLFAASIIELRVRNVGIPRAEGARLDLASGARWLAFTDADTVVSENWLVDQLRCGADAVCGVIGIEDWSGHSEAVRKDFVTTYHDGDGHRHIHGANLGVLARAYERAGGFPPLASREDIALVQALITSGAHIEWSANLASLPAREPVRKCQTALAPLCAR
jgi:glycosyltransferase involved in cell wall biosynthesis